MIDLGFLEGRTVAVLGLGKSGLTTARALAAGGAAVLAWDDGAAARAAAGDVALTDLAARGLAGVDLLVMSPGIPHTHPKPHPVAQAAKDAGIPLISDIELLVRALPGRQTIGITGTNGKSTTTTLIGHICALDGRPLAVGGNLGTPVLTFPMLPADGRLVLELSSYQLEIAPSLGCDVAVLLNITPDHLDRHGGMAGYVEAKRRIFAQAPDGAAAVIAVEDEFTRAIADALRAEGRLRVLPVSGGGAAVPGGIHVRGGVLIDDADGTARAVLDLGAVAALPGAHNHQNAAAAYAACKAAGVPEATIRRGIETFGGLAHRQQRIAAVDGVAFVNDSKATNPDAAAKALACYRPIYWIAGGQAKQGADMDAMAPFAGSIRGAFLIGEAAADFARWCDAQGIAHRTSFTLDAAVRDAFAAARGDDGAVILLSPACASFDQFRNFEHRGEAFAAAVRAIVQGEAA
ncbi:MAG TPA: UDP-N-acetylmuramoyl-L-alanine--D-glutamate ligase [Alphaproteobacteria bacterium]|nr:UDP-N-acetylmuramoyl-L-alanine--D-glutamate ligase [Alphaproteobacteria bacterium]